MATIGQADEINSTVPIDEQPPALYSPGRASLPSDTKTDEPQWPHTPMQVSMLEPSEPLDEPFVEQVEAPPHVPSAPHTVDALIVTRDRSVDQGARDDGTRIRNRLQSEEVGVNIGGPCLRTSLAKGDVRAAADIGVDGGIFKCH
jgi:hypothetical protein